MVKNSLPLGPIFPLASHYHMWDLFSGWGSGPVDVLSEVIHRLLFISAVHNLKIVNTGWLSRLPEVNSKALVKFVETHEPPAVNLRNYNFPEDFDKVFLKDGGAPHPIVLAMDWRPEVTIFKSQKKFVYLHLADFSDPGHHQQILARVKKLQKPLAGVLSFGVDWPQSMIESTNEQEALMMQWLRQLKTGGFFAGDSWEDFPSAELLLKRIQREKDIPGKLSLIQQKFIRRRWQAPTPIERKILLWEKKLPNNNSL